MREDLEHLRLLAIFHYIVAGLFALFSCFFFIYVFIGFMILNSDFPPPRGGGQPMPTGLGWFFIAFGGGLVVAGWLYSATLLFAGRSLMHRRRRVSCIVIAAVTCVFFPIGTVLGVFTLVVLLQTRHEGIVRRGRKPADHRREPRSTVHRRARSTDRRRKRSAVHRRQLSRLTHGGNLVDRLDRKCPTRCLTWMLSFLALGCGPSFGDVSGKVTYNARPLAFGSVMFLASDGRPYDATIDEAGNYAVRKVPVGLARIAVSCLTPIAATDPGDGVNKAGSRVGPLDESQSKIASTIPTRYGDFAKSKLVVTIESGRTTHDIELGD